MCMHITKYWMGFCVCAHVQNYCKLVSVVLYEMLENQIELIEDWVLVELNILGLIS